MLFKHDIEVKYSVFGKCIFFTWGHVNPLSAEVYPKMAKFAMKKTKFCRTSRRRFDEVETSPRAPNRSIFMQNLTLNTMHTFVWPQNDQKCLNFDVFVDMVILRGQNVYTRLWHSMG